MDAQDFVAWLMDEAKSRQGLRSDRALAQYLRISRGLMTPWRTGHARPGDESTVKLCKLASFPPEAGLLIINMARNSGVTATIYRRLLDKAGYRMPDLKSHRNAA